MTINLPPEWAKAQSVPTAIVSIKGQGGDVVATINVVGSATITTAWPYGHTTTPT